MRVPIPKYFTVKAVLEARLDREYVPGQRLPSEASLCADFNVSRVTIQQALALLAKEGRLRRRQGAGTFYVGASGPRTETRPSELLESVMKQRQSAFTRVVRKGIVPAPPRVAERLHLRAGVPVVALDRVGFVDHEPTVFINAFLPYDVGMRVYDAEAALRRTTLASLLHDTHRMRLHKVVQTIGASLADPAFAGALGLEIGAPVLEGERTYYDAAGAPVFFSITFYRADRHRFAVTLRKWR